MFDNIAEEYIDYMDKEKDLSPNTLEAYIRDLKKFNKYISKKNISNINDINKTLIIQYIISLQKLGRAPSTISRHLASIRCFFQYLLSQKIIDEDPTLNLRSPKNEKKPPSTLTKDEVEILMDQPNLDSFKGVRDKAILEFLYATGVQVSEARSINIQDLDLELGIVHIEDNNSKQKRTVPIGRVALESLDKYLELYRKEKKLINEEALFVNNSGNRLTRQGFWKILKSYSNTSKFKKNVTPQTLRHSFIAHLIENGADIETIQKIIGYSNIATVQIYASSSKKVNLRQAYIDTHPRA